MSNPTKGKVFLIGAGPGQADLITLRGVRCLKQCDLILYDYLVNPDILQHSSPEAETICLGSHGRKAWSQEQISKTIVDEALKGRTVGRLKGGDPIVFARVAEELDALVDANIDFEVVPGITAALAAGSYAGIPITHRDHASAVALVTGQEKDGKPDSAIDFAALARFPGTLVIYMGVTTAERWSSELIRNGMKPDTTVAMIRRCSWPNQQVIHCRLDEVAENVTPRAKFPPPVISIVGGVTTLAETLSWFQKKPLFGQRVLITRPADQAYDLAELVSEQGGDPIVQPAITIGPPDDWSPVDDAISRIGEFDWLVFSSANGVRRFMDRLFELGRDSRAIGSAKLCAIGPRTSDALCDYGLRCDRLPEEYRAESLAESLIADAKGKRFLLLRASRGREVLAETLRAAGGDVTQIVVYTSTDVQAVDDALKNQLANGEVDWVTVTSSAIAKSLASVYGDALKNAKLASISPITSETLRAQGFEPTVEATEYTTAGVISAMCDHNAPTSND